MSVCICMLVHGQPSYFAVAREAILSVVEQSDFDVFVGFCGDISALPQSPRVTYHPLADRIVGPQRPYRFLLKFESLSDCLASVEHDFLILMDADVILARPLNVRTIDRVLERVGFAMVEQQAIIGSDMNRSDFLKHYVAHALRVIGPGYPTPELDAFRYFNSGVVIGRRKSWSELVAWARKHIAGAVGQHEIGGHMITDQDYFQFWVNNLHPGSCAQLPWYWNHCEHWDKGFPRPGVLFAHFSNFCSGPMNHTFERMRQMRQRRHVWINTVASYFLQSRKT